ncbi:MAG: YihY/virulence factor BrkB family protein [Candidatus Methanoperedens sp.]|nr:YihY/virulence factor BrkB family protein [Candidatus Methanoperedens sp.]
MKFNIKQYILNSRPFLSLIEWSKKINFPGFDRLPLYYVVSFFLKAIRKEEITMRASSLAFNYLMAIFPTIIFLFTLIPYIPIENFQDEIFKLLQDVLPYNAFEATKSTIEDILKQQRGGLLSLGFALSIYYSTNAIIAMMTSFNNSYSSTETRSEWQKRLIALIIFAILSTLVLAAVSLIIFGGTAINMLVGYGWLKGPFTVILIQIGVWLIIFLLFFFAYSLLYYYGPSKRMKYRFISAGSTLATLLTIISSLGFAYYINNFDQYNKLYGSIGTLIVVMLWLYITSLVLLIGFELNASVIRARDSYENIDLKILDDHT